MRKTLLAGAFSLLLLPSLYAQDWSVGAGVGAFGFGRFVSRTQRVGNETDRSILTTSLSAAARPGVAVDVERRLTDRWGIRAEGAFTHAPLSVKNRTGGTGATTDAGSVNVTALSVPIVFHFQRHGAVRVHLFGGPAAVAYDIHQRISGGTVVPLFQGTRNRFGAIGGGGLDWWLGKRVAAEGEIAYINTASPFERTDVSSLNRTGLHIPRTQDVETRFGLRWRF